MVANLIWITNTNREMTKQRGKCGLRDVKQVATWRGIKEAERSIRHCLNRAWYLAVKHGYLCSMYKVLLAISFEWNILLFSLSKHSAISWQDYVRIYWCTSLFENWQYWVLTLILGRSSFLSLPGWTFQESVSSSLLVVQERLII